ncbi:NAD(P)/FAD-dependent oxidoreductase [Candidatus Woesearchaeota archaeon]|nr:NAD(P)/FAD-dependent oxidoreductase [Candidatus Woesearchaeota archaeon]
MPDTETYDIVVLGCGPAGLTLAWKAAEKGLSVLAIDKKKNPGDVNYTTLGSFMNLERWQVPKAITQPIDSCYFGSANETGRFACDAHVIGRAGLLDFIDRNARKSGAQTNYGVTLDGIETNDAAAGIKSITFAEGGRGSENSKAERTVTAKVFADCSGVSCSLGNRLGIIRQKVELAVGAEYTVPLKSEPGTIDLYVGSRFLGGYGWIAPLNNSTAIIGCGTLQQKMYGSQKKVLDGMFGMARVAERVENRPIAYHSATLRTGRPLRTIVKGNLIIVGDSALQVNPVVGEGVRFVMDSAEMAAEAASAAVKKGVSAELKGYEAAWKRKYYRSYLACYFLQRLANRFSGNDRLLDYALKKISRSTDPGWRNALAGDVSLGWLAKKVALNLPLMPLLLAKMALSGKAKV